MLSNHRFVEGGLFMTHFGFDRKTALADILMEIFFYYYDISMLVPNGSIGNDDREK